MSETTLPAIGPGETAAAAGTGRLYGLVVEFDGVDALKAAARRVRAAGYTRWDTHSPFPVHGMDEAMGIRHTRLPWVVFLFGVCGAALGVGLTWWTNATRPGEFRGVPTFLQGYDFLVSGKPLWSFPANIPVIFELTVLLAALAAVVGMLAMNGLPRWHHALFSTPRFRRVTADRFFLCIEAADPRFSEAATGALLAGLGGSAVERLWQPERTKLPRSVPVAALIVLCLALFPPLLVYKARVALSPHPRLHPIQDMDNQEKFKAQQAHPAFADGRAMRPPITSPGGNVPLTVARGDEFLLGTDRHFYEGWVGKEWASTFPARVEVTVDLMRRGGARFNVYCAPCHGLDGGGLGIVARRAREKPQISTGWVPPTSLHDPTVRERPVGHLFNTISQGIRSMPPYGDQLTPVDRWAIVAYIRALQRSQNASVEDVPPELRPELR